MEEITFEVQGSALEPYNVIFIKRSDNSLLAYCTCPAGEKGQYCKHRFSILDGKDNGIVSSNVDRVQVITSWLLGTDLELALNEMKSLEAKAIRIKKKLSAAKKQVAQTMMQGVSITG